MKKAPLPADGIVLAGQYTAEHVRADFTNHIVPAVTALSAVKEAADANTAHATVAATRNNVRATMMHMLRSALQLIPSYKRHVEELFKKHECKDAELVALVTRSHPHRREIARVVRCARRLSKEEVLNVERIDILLHLAVKLTKATERLHREELDVLEEVLKSRKWMMRVLRQQKTIARVGKDE